MNTFFKRMIALALCIVTVAGVLCACAGKSDSSETTQPKTDDGVLKVLTLGHSLAVDSGHMLALIADAEGYESMKVGTLYYSGCPLSKHVDFLTSNSAEYDLYISSTETPDKPPVITEQVTMLDAIVSDDWDVIVLQGGPFEIGKDITYKYTYIKTIQAYVNDHKLNPDAVFAWHMFWATPTDSDLRDTYPKPENNFYYIQYRDFGDDRTNLYASMASCAEDNILADDSFELLIPTGTAVENALTSYLTEKDLFRDYAHATDLGRVIASYTWYCKLAGVEELKEIKLDTIPVAFFKSTQQTEARILTDAEKQIILESVNNTLKEPLKVTPSAYTTAS